MDLFDLLVASWYLVSFIFLHFFRHLLKNFNLLSRGGISFSHYEAELVELGGFPHLIKQFLNQSISTLVTSSPVVMRVLK